MRKLKLAILSVVSASVLIGCSGDVDTSVSEEEVSTEIFEDEVLTEQEYRNISSEYSNSIASVLSEMVPVISNWANAPSSERLANEYDALVIEFENIVSEYNSQVTGKVPEEFEDVHSDVNMANSYYSESMYLFAEGVRELSPTKIEEANSLMSTGGHYTSSATDKLERMNEIGN